ncbi:unnamed protein product [Urochloa humidicola]
MKMDADGGGADAPAPASNGSGVSHRASSALAGVSVFLILLYLFWRFIRQFLKHEGRRGLTSGATDATATTSSSSPPPPSCPSRDGAAANGAAGEAAPRTTSRLPAFVRVAAAGHGAEKVDCAVCLAEIRYGEAAARLSPGCGHGFHAECIEAWLRVNSTCPLCRAAVDAPAPGPGAEGAPQ